MPVHDSTERTPAHVLADAAGRYTQTSPCRRLTRHIERIWRNVVAADVCAPLVIVPDARVDILWDGHDLIVAGPDTGPVVAHVPAGATAIGFQLRPAAANALLRAPMNELCDERVALTEFVGTRARTMIARARDADDASLALAELQSGLARLFADAASPDSRLQVLYARLQRGESEGSPELVRFARDAGLSERSMRRRSVEAFGYGPRTLARILRFGRFMDAMRSRRGIALAELATELGYADQAHMSREVSSFSGWPPGEVRRQIEGGLAVSFKTT